jgi:hypothetical protein
MRILRDEDLPRRLGKYLTGHDAETVPRSGWAGVKNGRLLALAATRFDVFLTMDQNLEFQQNLATLPIAVLVLGAASNRIEHLEPLVPELLSVLGNVQPKTLRHVGKRPGDA